MTTKLQASTVWLIAAAATVLGIGIGFLHLGSTVSLAAYFAVFGAAGFAATFATQANRSLAILAMGLAAVATGTAYYFIVGSAVGGATSAVTEGIGASASAAADAGGFMGVFFGGIAAFVTLVDALVAGIGGSIVGSRVRAQLSAGTLKV